MYAIIKTDRLIKESYIIKSFIRKNIFTKDELRKFLNIFDLLKNSSFVSYPDYRMIYTDIETNMFKYIDTELIIELKPYLDHDYKYHILNLNKGIDEIIDFYNISDTYFSTVYKNYNIKENLSVIKAEIRNQIINEIL